MNRWYRVFAATSLALALAVAAVSCDFRDLPDESRVPLVIGHLTTASAYDGSRYRAVALASAHFNLQGGVNGAPVVVVSRSTGADPDAAISIVQSVVENDGAIAMVGPNASSISVAIAGPVAAGMKLLFISPSATSPRLTHMQDEDFFFRTAVSDLVQGVVLANLAHEQGYSHVAVLHIADPYGEGLARRFEETFTELGGKATIVPHERGNLTYVPELERVSAGEAKVLIPISSDAETEIYVLEAIEGGYFDEFLLVDANKDPELMEAIGWALMDASLGTSAGAPDNRPQRKAFLDAYADFYGEDPHAESFVSESYDAAVLIGLAAAKAGANADAAAIRDALRSVANPPGEVVGPGIESITRALELIAKGEDINYEGASGDVDFDENGDVVGYIEIWMVANGQIVSTGRFELP